MKRATNACSRPLTIQRSAAWMNRIDDFLGCAVTQVEPSAPFKSRRRVVFVVAVAAWLGAAVAGNAMLARYKSTPGAVLTAPGNWPAGSTVPREPGRTALLLFAHPACPCTRASVAELEQLLTRFPSLAATVVAVDPAGLGPEHDSGIVAAAARLPGVKVVRAQPAEADLFGVLTSGHALLYDSGGHLLFSGGITGSRGHAGDNVGLDRITAILSGRVPDRRDSPVFGCALTERTELR